MVTRRIDAFDPVVITTTKIQAGTTNNVIPETAELIGTLRATSETRAPERPRRVSVASFYGIATAHEVEANVDADRPATRSRSTSLEFTEFARGVATELLGDGSYVDLPSADHGRRGLLVSAAAMAWRDALPGAAPRGRPGIRRPPTRAA